MATILNPRSSARLGELKAKVVKDLLIAEAKLGRPPSTLEMGAGLKRRVMEYFGDIGAARIAVELEKVRMEEAQKKTGSE